MHARQGGELGQEREKIGPFRGQLDGSRENGDSMFLRNVGTYLQVHKASRPRRTSTSLPP
jgi:hypothetical protein